MTRKRLLKDNVAIRQKQRRWREEIINVGNLNLFEDIPSNDSDSATDSIHSDGARSTLLVFQNAENRVEDEARQFVQDDHFTDVDQDHADVDHVDVDADLEDHAGNLDQDDCVSLNASAVELSSDIDSYATDFDDDFLDSAANSDFSDLEDDFGGSNSTEVELRKDLANWATEDKIPRTSVNKLLQILRKHESTSFLPSDYRTLLKTKRDVETRIVNPGNYYHFGLVAGLLSALDVLKIENVSGKLLVQINIDGNPLVKSSGSQFWPICGLIRNMRENIVFPVGI